MEREDERKTVGFDIASMYAKLLKSLPCLKTKNVTGGIKAPENLVTHPLDHAAGRVKGAGGEWV